MKKILLLACGLTMMLADRADAQSFMPQTGSKDTMTAYYDGNDELQVKNYLKSTSANNVYIRWHITNYNLATGWTFNGLCDNNLCYTDNATLSGANNVSNGYGQNYGDFHVAFGGLNAAAVGSYSYVKANLRDTISGSGRDLTFIGYKSPLGVISNITSTDEVTLFPNPAREAVNVIFNDKAGVKTIAIYNLIGKVMNVYKPTDNGSAKLDIDNIPAGVYFLRLMDGKGHILATRRFTRQ